MQKKEFRSDSDTRFLLYIICILFLPVLSACRSTPDDSFLRGPDRTDYVLLEFHTVRSGELLEGTYPPGRVINGYTYILNDDGTLYAPGFDGAGSDSLIAFLAITVGLAGTEGSGTSAMLHEIYSLPYKNEELHILRMSKQGTAYLAFGEEELSLQTGEEWTRRFTRTDTLQYSNSRSVTELTVTESIRNKGIFKKSQIIE
jgi:hypothetical protein